MFNYKDHIDILRNTTFFSGQYKSDAHYYLYTSKQESCQIYIGHIIFNSRLKVSNYVELSHMQEEILKTILNLEENYPHEETCFIALIDLKAASPLMPDLKVFSKGNQFKDYIEGKYKISLGGVVTIVPDMKTYNRYNDSVKALLKDANMYIAITRPEAKFYLKELIAKRG